MSYLASIVCRYMDELMRKDKQLILSSRALETIYHTVRKLISGKHYLGGYALDQLCDKLEAEGKEIPLKKKKKKTPKDTSKPSTSAMVH